MSPVGFIGGAERVLLAAIRGVRAHLQDAHLHLILFSDGPLRIEAERVGVEVRIVALPDRLSRLGDSQFQDLGRLMFLAKAGWSGLRGLPAMLWFIGRLRHELLLQAPDLIHSNGLKAHALLALARPGRVPVLWHLHDFLAGRPAMAWVLRRLRRGVAGALAISSAVRRDVETMLPGLPVWEIPNAVDTDHFAPAERDGAVLDRMAGLNLPCPGTIRIGLVATYARWKGQDVFIDALKRISHIGLPVRGYIVGGSIYRTARSQFDRDELERRVEDHGLAGRVGFIEFQADPADVYRMLDVAVHASIRPEPFGLSIVEAMACGKPVIVSKAGGAAELFTDGYDGIGHPPGDAAMLAQAILRLLNDSGVRSRIGSNARHTAVERYSLDRYSRQIASVIQSCLALNAWRAGARATAVGSERLRTETR